VRQLSIEKSICSQRRRVAAAFSPVQFEQAIDGTDGRNRAFSAPGQGAGGGVMG
jgi:hypothetical protein